MHFKCNDLHIWEKFLEILSFILMNTKHVWLWGFPTINNDFGWFTGYRTNSFYNTEVRIGEKIFFFYFVGIFQKFFESALQNDKKKKL